MWIALCALGLCPIALAAEDPYLKSLRSEASKVTDLTKAQEEQRRVGEAAARQQAIPRATSAASGTPAGNRAELEQTLRDQFPGTFALYLRFSEPDKLLVVREFETSNAGGIARYHPVINKVVQISIARY